MKGTNENKAHQDCHSSHNSHRSRSSSEAARPVIPPRGDYETLLSFQKSEVVYDITFRFAHKSLARGDRTIDQMIQSARSGRQAGRQAEHPGREQSGHNVEGCDE